MKLAKRIGKWVGALLLVALVFVGYQLLKFMHTDEVRFDDKALAVIGGGGNTLILDSDAGPLVVDTKFFYPASQLKDTVQRATGKPVKMVISTHYHPDHTGGNPKYVGAEFVGAPRTPVHMLEKIADTYGPGKPGERAVPTTLVDSSKVFPWGDDEVEVRYAGRGHTDGDVFVFLRKRRILHMGDLFFNGFYPVIDAEAGASMREWGPALDAAIALAPTKVIPGHGPVCTVEELKVFRAYVGALWDFSVAEVKAGKSREQALKEFDDARFGLKAMLGISFRDKNIGFAYDEAKAWVAAGHG